MIKRTVIYSRYIMKKEQEPTMYLTDAIQKRDILNRKVEEMRAWQQTVFEEVSLPPKELIAVIEAEIQRASAEFHEWNNKVETRISGMKLEGEYKKTR